MKKRNLSDSFFSTYHFRFQNYILYFLLAILACLFLIIFSFYTSPITKIYGYDASFFQLVGQGMKQGMLPYRDFFDMKGPYMFLIEYIGQVFCDSRLGIFLIQFINLYLSLFFILKIHRLFQNKVHPSPYFELLSLFPYLWIAAATFEGGNLTEEFCLPALILCMYYYLKYIYIYIYNKNDVRHPPCYAFIYGISFGYITLIRITNAAMICAIIFCIFFSLLAKQQYRNILYNAVFFIIGFIAAVMPAVMYCLYHDILFDMIYAVFVFGYTYAAEDGLFRFSLSQIQYFMPMFIPMIMCCISKRRKKLLFPTLVMFIALVLSLSMGNQYLHYFTISIPYITLGGALIIEMISLNPKNIKKNFCCFAICALCLITLSPRVLAHGGKFVFSALDDHYLDYQAREISSHIPVQEKNNVYTWGISSKWYLETDTYPCIKYCDWQDHYISLSPEIQSELKLIFAHNAPAWVVTNNWSTLPGFLQNELSLQYEKHANNNSYTLYRHIP